MAVKIGHAVHSETGGREGESGDQIQQQGKRNEEVQISKWYVSGDGWGWYIEAKDADLLERMAQMMEQACANPNIGYSRTNRYKWYNSAKANGGDVSLADGDCDCSSLVSGIANLAGAGVTNKLSTASMLNAFKKSGNFNIYTDADHLKSDKLARRGGIYLRVGHTLMVLEDGSDVGSEPITTVQDVKPPYVLVIGNKVNIRNGSGTEFDDIGDAYKGDKYPYQGTDSSGKKWYMIEFEDMTAFISPLPNLTKLVLKDESTVNEEAGVDPPYVQIKGKVNVRFPAGLEGDIIYTAKNERLPFEEVDADTGWFGVMSPKGAGFVSCNLPNNAILVEK
jgi:hypothetical protein